MPPDQTTVSPASYQLPPQQKPPYKNQWILITVIVVILVLIVAGVLYLFTPVGAYVRQLLGEPNIPSELQAATFLSDRGPDATSVYQLGKSLKPTEKLATAIISETINPSGTARITRTNDGTFDVFLNGTSVLKDKSPRVGISRSPDGTQVVFAQASSTLSTFVPPAENPLFALNLKSWEVVVYNPSTHTTINLGEGASPFFVDKTHVAWISPAGLAVTDLMSSKTSILVQDTAMHVASVALISPDHSIVASYDPTSKKLSAYKVTTTTATALPTSAIPSATSTINPIRSISLGNDSFYMIRTAIGPTELLQEAFGQEAKQVGTVPASLSIDRLVLGTQ